MMTKEIPKITACDVTDCVYNKHSACHTPAITVGGPGEDCPKCDTFTKGANRGGIMDMTGGVGACKVDACSYNRDLECSAPSIKVGRHQGHPDCLTFQPR
jgi:hypothetical protein